MKSPDIKLRKGIVLKNSALTTNQKGTRKINSGNAVKDIKVNNYNS